MNALNSKEKREGLIYALLSIFAFLSIWQGAVVFTEIKKIMPDPISVFTAFYNALFEPIGEKIILEHVLASLLRVFSGYFLACLIGVAIGIIMGCSKIAEAVIKPVFEVLRPIPGLAWIPISILWFGIGEGAKVFIICVSASVSIVVNAYNGAKSVDPVLIGASRMLGANQFQQFFYIILPSSVPSIFAGLQVGLSASWMAVLAAEMVRSSEGVGWIIITGMEGGDTVQILVGMISIALVGLLLATLLRAIERRLCEWNIRGT